MIKRARFSGSARSLLWGIAAGVVLVPVLAGVAMAGDTDDPTEVGREIFVREWLPNDSRSHGGDGLGPVFNDTSCVACHNQGGVGGAGPRSKNVDVISAFASGGMGSPFGMGMGEVAGPLPLEETETSLLRRALGAVLGVPEKGTPPQPVIGQRSAGMSPAERAAIVRRQRDLLRSVHPGFLTARSVVLHRFGTSPQYDEFRGRLTGTAQFADVGMAQMEAGGLSGFGPQLLDLGVPGQTMLVPGQNDGEIQQLQMSSQIRGQNIGPVDFGEIAIVRSQRNAIALFGAGLIDSISEEAIEAAANRRYSGFPQVSGRVARLDDGSIGRFGWKAQKASLHDFVVTACAVELGLHVPGHDQAGSPQNPHYRAPGLDLDQSELDSLVSYVSDLPRPEQRIPAAEREAEVIELGRQMFVSTGCSACHTPDLDEVEGLYSDLLLHDMGPELADTGSYGTFVPNDTEETGLDDPLPNLFGDFAAFDGGFAPGTTMEPEPKDVVGALRHEWRTTPLWGVRDSAPYLHDGRADTIEEAISFHGGEASESRSRFFALSLEERMTLLVFLKSLEAPGL